MFLEGGPCDPADGRRIDHVELRVGSGSGHEGFLVLQPEPPASTPGRCGTVFEVQGSGRVAELRDDTVPEWRSRRVMRHFMVFTDGFGGLELVAGAAALDDEDAANPGGTRSVDRTPSCARQDRP